MTLLTIEADSSLITTVLTVAMSIEGGRCKEIKIDNNSTIIVPSGLKAMKHVWISVDETPKGDSTK